MQQQPNGAGALLLAAGAGLAVGAAAGYAIASGLWWPLPAPPAPARAPTPPAGGNELVGKLNLHFPPRAATDASSTPGDTPRTLSRADEEGGSADGARPPRMVVLCRTDLQLSKGELIQQATRSVLGQWKKLWKRRDPALRSWEAGGSRLEVMGTPSEDDMLLVQSAARSLALPTHTFAGRDRTQKQRTVMVVGPANEEAVEQITLHLTRL